MHNQSGLIYMGRKRDDDDDDDDYAYGQIDRVRDKVSDGGQ